MKKRIHQIELFMKYPFEVQNELLEGLIKKAKKTKYGKKFGFDSIENYEHFRSKVPIVYYEELYPYIERLMKGEQNLLWPSEVRWFAKSSGTTNSRSKFIPVSNEALEDCHYKGGKDLLSIYFNNYPNAKMFSGKGLVIGGSHQLNQFDENSKSYYGDVSAVLLKNLPWWAQVVRTPSLDVALMDEWEEKIDRMVEITSDENVTNISGAPTWMIVLLEKILTRKSAKNILEVWPNLEVFFHGAVSFIPYRELFKKLIPSSKMRYMETYNASEGFFGIQDQTGSSEMLLMLDYGIFYEFAPFDEMGKDHPKTLTLNEVEVGKNYAMLITTNAGLWRYMIGDTVTFTSKMPYRIKISGRTKHFINAFGEELIIENAELAIAEACKKTEAVIDNFTVGPKYLGNGNKGSHEWVVEFLKVPNDLGRFTKLLDEKLRELNSDYDAKRYRDIALIEPIIHVVSENTFYHWMKSKDKLGGQHKVPRLSNTREYLDELLSFKSVI
ncbi:MAG: GH3 auxin-responsive promoter family protein [Ekhidna sp.]|nr:GH3 auxin-responsive promoter family protein [Ekhidna sp.]MBC6410239.1 GH3 auxin-responsive promoter family protein [Ekhidna sp.]MBC6426224.1 GH3 auxin-responsive promoter family protein [Ekhidna sp.]